MEDTHIVQMYWDRNETAISESAVKYVHTVLRLHRIFCRIRRMQKNVSTTPGFTRGMPCHAAAPAVSAIHISWKNNEKSFV